MMREHEILLAFYRAVEDASDNKARGDRLLAIERALEEARAELENENSAGRVLVASADAPAKLPPLPEGVQFDDRSGLYQESVPGTGWSSFAELRRDGSLRLFRTVWKDIPLLQVIAAHAAKLAEQAEV